MAVGRKCNEIEFPSHFLSTQEPPHFLPITQQSWRILVCPTFEKLRYGENERHAQMRVNLKTFCFLDVPDYSILVMVIRTYLLYSAILFLERKSAVQFVIEIFAWIGLATVVGLATMPFIPRYDQFK